MSSCRWLAIALLLPLTAAGGDTLPDPMRPPGATALGAGAKAAPPYTLTATRIGRDSRVAIINGRQVGIGDRIGAARVRDILPTQVRLEKGGRTIVLSLLPVAVKQPATIESKP